MPVPGERSGTPNWTDVAWLAEVESWIDGVAADAGRVRVGDLDQLHVRPWATVIRVPTDRGDLWLKANAPRLVHEAALVTALSSRRPEVVAPPLACDLDRGWMLMEDAGVQLRELIATERRLDRWLDVLRRYAELQIDVAGDADALVALGVRDLRLERLPRLFADLLDELTTLEPAEERRLRDAAPLVAELCEDLAGFGLPATIQHDDLHDGQVYARDDRYLVLDWGDACVSHPFFTMAVTLDGVIAWGVDDVERSEDTAPYRDAYLRPFAEAGLGNGDLADACAIARRLGWACRAVNGHLGGEADAQTRTRLRMLLDGRP